MKLAQIILSLSFHAISALAFECTASAFDTILPSNASTLYAIPVPANGTFGEGPSNVAYPRNATNLPALCAVSVNVISSATSSFTFGLFLPNDWNGRFLAVGNGGFLGGINWLELGSSVRYGFAVMSTNTGHNSTNSNSTWALNNPEAEIDWSYRAMHGSILIAKDIVSAFYSNAIEYSYYSGCSTGGYQGLNEVQDYPEDFDGVLVGAPAWWHSHLQTWSIKVGIYNLPNTSAHHIPSALFPIIGAEVIRQCDETDGVADGIISEPRACSFYPEALLCTPSTTNRSACLTSPQIDTLNKIYADYVETNQTFIFPGLELGSESQWNLVAQSVPDAFSIGYVQNLVYDDPTWQWWNFSLQTIQDAERINGPIADADNFDISPFQARGGKLLQYHGYADGFIQPGSSKYYYDHVVRTLAPMGIDVTDFFRFFLVPGMRHCSSTVVGAPWYIAGSGQANSLYSSSPVRSVPGYEDADHDALLALMRWVENGTAPEEIIATYYENNTVSEGVVRQRPLCPYPGRAVYCGEGSVNEPGSWRCEAV